MGAHLGDAEEALSHLGEVRTAAEHRGFDMMVWYFYDAEAEALARLERWDSCRRALDEAKLTSARPGLHADTIAATWKRTARLAADAGRAALEEACRHLAEAVLDDPLPASAGE